MHKKIVSLAITAIFLLNAVVTAAPLSGNDELSALAPRSEGTADHFKDLQEAIRLEEQRREGLNRNGGALAHHFGKESYELKRSAESFFKMGKVAEGIEKLREAKQAVRKDLGSVERLYKEYLELTGGESVDKLVQAHFLLEEHRSFYEHLNKFEDDAIKGIIVDNMGSSFRSEFEEFAGRPVRDMSYGEMQSLITPFNALKLRRQNKAEIDQILRDGFFDVNYVMDQYLDPMLDMEGMQAETLRKYGVVVGGDAIIVLRDDNGDIYLFEMDASGHGWFAAKVLDAVIPFIYKKWEERSRGFLNEDFIRDLDLLVERCREFKGQGLEYLPFNAVRIGAYDGKVDCYSLGADPALFVNAKGFVQKMRTEGSPLGLIESTGIPSQRLRSVMKKGDRLIMHSDGVSDARTPARGMYQRKMHEFISAYVVQNQSLEMERAADEVLKKMKGVIQLSPNEEEDLRRYVSEKYEALISYDEMLKEVFERNPKLSPELLTESILKDIVIWTGAESKAHLWNDYVEKSLDAFFDTCSAPNEALYDAVLQDLKDSRRESPEAAEKQLEHARAIGNSLKFLAFIQEHMALPSDELKKLIKENHAAFSGQPVSYAEMVGDDLCMVSMLYKGPPKKKDLLLPDRSVGSIDIALTQKIPSVFGDENYAEVFAEIFGPAAEAVPLNELLKKAGPVHVNIVEGKKLAYHKGGALYINDSLFMPPKKLARMGALSEQKAKKWLSEEEELAFRSLKESFSESVAAVQFVLYVNLLYRASQNEAGVAAWKDIYGKAVQYFLTLSRRSQDSLLAILRQFRKADYLTDSFVRIFSQVKLTGLSQVLDKEIGTSAALVAQKDAADRLAVLLFEIEAGKDRWREVQKRLSSLSGADIQELDMEDEVQPLLASVWGLVTDERTAIGEAVRQEVIAETKKVMYDIIAARQRSLTASQSKILAGAHELLAGEISILRDFFLRDLISGDMAVKGLSFRNDDLVCRIKKGKQQFGTLALNDMHVYKRGTREFVIIDKEEDVPVVLEIDVETRKLSIRKYFDDKTYTFLFPEKDIEIKKPKLATSGIMIRRETSPDRVHFIADGMIGKDGRLTIEKIYEPAALVKNVPDLRSGAVAETVSKVFERASRLYRPADRVRIRFVSGNERTAATAAYTGREPLIAVDIEGLLDPDLFLMDLEEELMHLEIAKMPAAQRPPLAIEEIMTALLKVHRFRSYPPDVKARILNILRSQKNNLDDQGFYEILSFPAALSHDAQIEAVISYVGRPGVYPEEVAAYLSNRSPDDIKDELHGRIAGADGWSADWYSAILEMFPRELTDPAGNPAAVLPIEELLSYIYRTHHQVLRRYIESIPP
ncbi:MAG TPA: SpoIIE family protein phosphatase, partial [bacterium]|nr:SpoIIE family protein phosphatase [bacterium]